MSNSSLSSRLLQNLVQAANTGIVVTDAKLKDNPIIFANDAFYSMTGYGPDETIGFNCRFLQGKDAAQREVDVIRQSVKNGEPCKVVLKNYRKDNTPFWNELYVTPYFDEQGELTHFFGVQHDVTDAVEQRLEKDMFNAGVLHDIKSPLMGQARILEYMAKQSNAGGSLEGVSSVMLQTLKDSMHLVSDTLDLYKLENELVVPNLATVTAKTFIQSVIDSVKDDARDKRIQLHCLQPEGDHQVTFDTSMVFRALKNLVENAVCYSQPGKDIWILSSANNSGQMIAVVDQGSGLPTQIVNQFEDSAAPSALRSAFESPVKHKSSLGLLACGQIMRAHNGKLNLIKSDRFGTEFALIFPLYTLAQRSGNLSIK